MRELIIDGFEFNITDFERSATAAKLNIDNKIPAKDLPDFQHLIDKVIVPIQKRYGGAIYVNSGYRNPEVNKRVGGAKTSQHMSPGDDAASDLNTRKGQVENRRLFEIIRQMTMKREIPIDQLIDEYNCKWIHVSSKRIGFNRYQITSIR